MPEEILEKVIGGCPEVLGHLPAQGVFTSLVVLVAACVCACVHVCVYPGVSTPAQTEWAGSVGWLSGLEWISVDLPLGQLSVRPCQGQPPARGGEG